MVSRESCWCAALALSAAIAATAQATTAAGQEPPAGGQAAPGAGRSVMDGVFTADQAVRGEQQFMQACTSCHTVDKMTGNRFRTKWGDGSVGEVFDFMSNAMPEGDPGSLMPEQYASIIAFFLRASGYPAGAQELSTDKADLLKVRIVPLEK